MIGLSIDGAVATLTLNRPEAYNAFSKAMRSDLLEALQAVDANDAVRVCILKGEGKGFSAGHDLRDETVYDDISDLIVGEYLPCLEIIQNSNVLFIAQTHGNAAGIGSAFAMTCDFVTMADDSTINLAFAAISLMPDGGATYHLMNAFGYRRALEMIVEGRQISAQTCHEVGIASRVHAADALDSETRAWADSLTKRAPLAVAATKRVLRSMAGRSFTDTVKVEAQEQNALAKSNDYKRGVAGFQTRTPPVFEGN